MRDDLIILQKYEDENPDNSISYWYHKLNSFLKENNKSLRFALDVQEELEDFLVTRAKLASLEWDAAIESGLDNDQALELSFVPLYMNVNYNAEELIEDYLDEHFKVYYDKLVKDGKIMACINELSGYCKDAFRKLSKANQDLFNESDRKEIIREIAEYLEKNKHRIFVPQ